MVKRASPAEIVDGNDGGDDNVSLLREKPISRNAGNNPENAISVRETRGKRRIIDLSLSNVSLLCSSISSITPKNPLKNPSIRDQGQSLISKSDPKTFTCEICFDLKLQIESFKIMGCSHFYCSECVIKYVASKLQENVTRIPCPVSVSGCEGVLELDHCRNILPPEVFDRWGSALCEAAAEKFYCPFKDCSALIDDGRGEREECPNCRRLFCARCKVPWHSQIKCEEFEKLNEDEREREDIMLMNLAKKKRWMRCPRCKIYVERASGCSDMRCRCRQRFCYDNGEPLTSTDTDSDTDTDTDTDTVGTI